MTQRDPSRRSVLRTALAAAFASALPASAATAKSPNPQSQVNENLYKALRYAPQFTMCGDTDHSDMSILGFMAQESTSATFAALGVKHIFIERPTQLQYLIDGLANGSLSRQDYIDGMEQNYICTFQNGKQADRLHGMTGDLVLNAKKHGIKIYGVDSNDAFAPAWTDQNLIDALTKAISNDPEFSNMNTTDQEKWAVQFASTYDAAHSKEIQNLDRLILEKRLAQYKDIAQNMETLAAGKKAVIFYGAAHADGFGRIIGQQNILKVAMLGYDAADTISNCLAAEGWNYYDIEANKPLLTPSAPAAGRQAQTRAAFNITPT